MINNPVLGPLRTRRASQEGILAGVDQSTGEVKTIDQVPSGKACHCICPHCKIALIAKKGERMVHHFAHESVSETIRSCQETALHETAKIVAAHLVTQLSVPGRERHFNSQVKVLTNSGKYQVQTDSVSRPSDYLERLGGSVEPIVPAISPYRPDAKMHTVDGEIFIEIHVTNPVAPEKKQAMYNADLAVLEIDLSETPRTGLSLEEVIHQVTEGAKRSWVSEGLREKVYKARKALDEEIRIRESEHHRSMLRQLRKASMAYLPSKVLIQAVSHQHSDRGIPITGKISVSNLRCEKGYWLVDIAHAPGTVVTALDDEIMLNRLFAWHQKERRGSLNLISISETNRFISNDFETVKAVAGSLRQNRPSLPDKIDRVQLVDKHFVNYRFAYSVTPAKLKAFNAHAYADSEIPEHFAREMILNGFADVVVSHSKFGWNAYCHSIVAKRMDGAQPDEGVREQVFYRVQYYDPCLVRFFPSVSDSLAGDLFDQLSIYQGELYLVHQQMGPIRIHFNRRDFWKHGGLLILEDAMRRGVYNLEPSSSFLSELKSFSSQSE